MRKSKDSISCIVSLPFISGSLLKNLWKILLKASFYAVVHPKEFVLNGAVNNIFNLNLQDYLTNWNIKTK